MHLALCWGCTQPTGVAVYTGNSFSPVCSLAFRVLLGELPVQQGLSSSSPLLSSGWVTQSSGSTSQPAKISPAQVDAAEATKTNASLPATLPTLQSAVAWHAACCLLPGKARGCLPALQPKEVWGPLQAQFGAGRRDEKQGRKPPATLHLTSSEARFLRFQTQLTLSYRQASLSFFESLTHSFFFPPLI